MERPLRIVNSTAPIRVCDNGGWTDTWFARHGKVFNIAVSPCVEVQMKVFQAGDRPRITIHAENYGDRYSIGAPNGSYTKHPLIEAAIEYMKVPEELAIEVCIYSEVPAGCSTGTSAAVSVALIGALDCLTPGRMTAYEVASTAQRIETEILRQQCGIQDQLASAYGGINFIDMFEYPHAAVSPVIPPEEVLWELESRLSLVFVGQTHSSSEVHQTVIRDLEGAGPTAPKLRPLRFTAEKSKDALLRGDFVALGAAMIENTEAQRGLHPSLVGPSHQEIIEIARSYGALGWKVNGAGGAGGSLTILGGESRSQSREMLAAVAAANPAYQIIPIRLNSHGLRRWETGAASC